ncbi:hypothetical protein LUZ61_022846 [Rhynchospora tenuis]|uniref:Transmembrane protein n=1 Tax=Rhynchospora tenuis TaxID=198213 RepID=A0AAD5YWT8_9POAL|nr:hypothetical protein LUZ61_022846 [Rhynchospora tenuis]
MRSSVLRSLRGRLVINLESTRKLRLSRTNSGPGRKKGQKSINQNMARKGNPISVRLGKNRSSDSSRFSASALLGFLYFFIYFVAPTLGPVLFILRLVNFYFGLGLELGNEMFHFGVGPDGGAPGLDLNQPPQERPPLGVNGGAPAALDLNELPPVHLLYAEVEGPQSFKAQNDEMLAHLRRVQHITQDLETERNIWRRQALIDILDWEVRNLQQHFRIFRQRDRLREGQRSWLRDQIDRYR